MYLFSIIIPHYNSTPSLKLLLSSIPNDGSIQLIVIDDKSTEDLTEVRKLVLARNGIFLNNTSSVKGAGTCRNLGLAQATGKWLVFADADDYFLDGAFKTMQQYTESDAEIIYFSPTSRHAGTGLTAKRHTIYARLIFYYTNTPSETNEMLLRCKFMVPWSKMIKNTLVKENNILFDEVPASNDVMFSLKTAYYAKKVFASPAQIYCVTSARNTLTSQKNEQNYWARVEVFVTRYQFMYSHLDLEKYGFILPKGLSLIATAVRQRYSPLFIFKIYSCLREHHIAVLSFKNIHHDMRQYIRWRQLVRKSASQLWRQT